MPHKQVEEEEEREEEEKEEQEEVEVNCKTLKPCVSFKSNENIPSTIQREKTRREGNIMVCLFS